MIIDDFISLIWTERYYDYGDFELKLPLKEKYFKNISIDQYLGRNDTTQMMIIEKIDIVRSEMDSYIQITGQAIEAMLGYRIIYKQDAWKGTVEGALREMVYRNCVHNEDTDRNLPIVLGENNGWVTEFNAQFRFKNLGEWVKEVCKSYEWGFKLVPDNTNFIFTLYRGNNYSGNVLFSFEYGNIFSHEKYFDISNYKNVAIVGGEGEGNARKVYEYENSTGNTVFSGVDRREIFIDAGSMSSNNGQISDIDYQEQCYQNAMQTLAGYTKIEEEAISTETGAYKYRIDYNVGDIVMVDSGIDKGERRIIEMIESFDENGYTAVPTFS